MIPKKLKRNLTRALRKERGFHFPGRVVVVKVEVMVEVDEVGADVVEVVEVDEDVVVEVVELGWT